MRFYVGTGLVELAKSRHGGVPVLILIQRTIEVRDFRHFLTFLSKGGDKDEKDQAFIQEDSEGDESEPSQADEKVNDPGRGHSSWR